MTELHVPVLIVGGGGAGLTASMLLSQLGVESLLVSALPTTSVLPKAALPSLLAFAKPGHVLFGSDWPYAPAPAVSYFTGQLDAYPGLDEAGHRAIDRESAAALFAKED